MLRFVGGRVSATVSRAIVNNTRAPSTQIIRASHDGPTETDEEFDARYEAFFNRPDIDHWEIRKAMNDLAGTYRTP